MLTIRNYETGDWDAVERIHDSARKRELELAGMPEAFLPLEIAAKREGLFGYPGLYVAEFEGAVAGFAACTEEELAWLYVDPAQVRKGIGRSLSRYALDRFPGICTIEVLRGNEPARRLYESLGFSVGEIQTGHMPGNEAFTVEVYCMRRV